MITLDLFETEPPARDPVDDPRTATDQATKALSLFIYQELVKAYKSGAPISTIEWTTPGVPVMTLSRNQIYTVLWNYAMALKKGPKKGEEFARMFANRTDLFNYVGSLKKILKAPPAADIPAPKITIPGEQGPVQATQGRLFKEAEKKSSEDSKYRDVRVARAMRQAAAEFPSAGSDVEAFAKSMLNAQDKDQEDIARLRQASQRQRELIKKNDSVDADQQRTITNIEKEINDVERSNSTLEKTIQQMQRANTALQQKLDQMRGRVAPVQAAPELGVSVATDKVTAVPAPVAEPTEPAGVSVATDKQAQPASLPKPKRRRTAKPIATAQPATVGGTSAEVLPKKQVRRKKGEQAPLDLDLPKVNGSPKVATDVEVDEVPGIDANYGNLMAMLKGQNLEPVKESTIPLKSVVQGYTVEYNPQTRRVTVSRGGQVIGSAINKSGNPKYHSSIVTKIIDRAEEDKYPTNIDVRVEGSVFGQQDFDTQMDLAKLKSQLTQPKPAQSAPASAEPQPVPARLSDLQSKKQRIDNLASIKQDIEKLQARATRGGRMLPRGLAADLEDYFTIADIDTAYDDMMAKYQKQLGALQQYLGMRKVLWTPRKDVHEMKAKELQEGGPETWTVHFTDGTTTRVRVPSDETDPAQVRAFFAKKGKTVKKFDYGFTTEPAAGPGPERHEPGSGTARSARTGDELKEGRAGYNPLTSKEHWYEVERQLAQLINDRTLDAETRAEARQRYLEKRKEAQ